MKAIERVRRLKKERMHKGIDSTADLLQENEEEKKPQKEEEDQEHNEESEEEEEDSMIAELEDRTHLYKCPVYKTTLRLAKDLEFQEKVPLFYIELPTKIHPRRWVKRSVALLLETTR